MRGMSPRLLVAVMQASQENLRDGVAACEQPVVVPREELQQRVVEDASCNLKQRKLMCAPRRLEMSFHLPELKCLPSQRQLSYR